MRRNVAAVLALVLLLAVLAPAGNFHQVNFGHVAKLQWTAADGATGYNVYRSTTSGSGYVLIGTTTGTSWADPALALGGTYYYVVTSLAPSFESAYSSEVMATIPSQ